MYGVFSSKEEHDLWMAEYHGAMAKIAPVGPAAEEKADVLEMAQAGEVLGDIVQAFGGGSAADIAARISNYIDQAERAAKLAAMIPSAELGQHAELIDTLVHSNSKLAAFARGFARGLK